MSTFDFDVAENFSFNITIYFQSNYFSGLLKDNIFQVRIGYESQYNVFLDMEFFLSLGFFINMCFALTLTYFTLIDSNLSVACIYLFTSQGQLRWGA